VSPVSYELGFYIPEEGILHSHRRENLKSYILVLTKFLVFLLQISRQISGYRLCSVTTAAFEIISNSSVMSLLDAIWPRY
jgi:hypothetical protein